MGELKKYWRVKIAGKGTKDFGSNRHDATKFAETSKKESFAQVTLESKLPRKSNWHEPRWKKETYS